MYLVYCFIFAVISYIVVNSYKEKYPDLDVSPMLYALCTFMFGIIIPMIFFAIKVNAYKKYSK